MFPDYREVLVLAHNVSELDPPSSTLVWARKPGQNNACWVSSTHLQSRAAYPVSVVRASGLLLGSVSRVCRAVMRTSTRVVGKRHTRRNDG